MPTQRPQDGPRRVANAFYAATGRDLESDHGKPRYLAYQRELIRPHCGRTVLEVGAGLGEFAAGFTGVDRYVVTDVDAGAVQKLKERFAHRPEVEVQQYDIDGTTTLSDLRGLLRGIVSATLVLELLGTLLLFALWRRDPSIE